MIIYANPQGSAGFRMSNAEGRMTNSGQFTYYPDIVRHLAFVIPSTFVIRDSSFRAGAANSGSPPVVAGFY
jgi:hypothetical protein